MYMREMGTVELLTREGEIRIAKRIEEGLEAVRTALSMYPATHDFLLRAYEPVKVGQARLVDVIVGFIDPNAPDVIAQPQNPTKLEIVEAEAESEREEEAEDGDEPVSYTHLDVYKRQHRRGSGGGTHRVVDVSGDARLPAARL